MRRLIPLAMVTSFLTAPLAPVARADDTSLEKALVESATTPQQHAALANYYAGKAAAAREEAAAHREMAKTYGGVKGSQLAMMKEHCEKLASLSDDEAQQYDTMASAHREMAK